MQEPRASTRERWQTVRDFHTVFRFCHDNNVTSLKRHERHITRTEMIQRLLQSLVLVTSALSDEELSKCYQQNAVQTASSGPGFFGHLQDGTQKWKKFSHTLTLMFKIPQKRPKEKRVTRTEMIQRLRQRLVLVTSTLSDEELSK